MNDEAIIRPLRPDERDAVRALHRDAFPDGTAFSDAVLDRLFHHQRGVHLVALRGDRVVGYACALHGTGDTAEIATLHVDLPQRGRGIAQSLLKELEERLRARRVCSVSLHVHVANERAQRLYEKSGYRIAGEDPDGYPHMAPRTALVLRKDLR